MPILQDDDVKGFVGVTITLQATSADNPKKLSDLNPIVRDKILVNIYSIMYLIWQPSYTPDLDSIKRYVEKSIEETLQEDVIDTIYLKDFYFRKAPRALPKS